MMRISKQSMYGVLLIVSVILNILLGILFGVHMNTHQPQSIVGTYCTGDGMTQKALYIAFDQDGAFATYRQFQPLEAGVYHQLEDSIYKLEADDMENNQFATYNGTDEVHIADGESVLRLKRISDIPTYINYMEDE